MEVPSLQWVQAARHAGVVVGNSDVLLSLGRLKRCGAPARQLEARGPLGVQDGIRQGSVKTQMQGLKFELLPSPVFFPIAALHTVESTATTRQ